MKIVITEAQLEIIKEYFSPMENIKAYMDYHLGFDKQRPYGANDFSKYKSIKLFQKFVDLAYKYTKKIADFDGVEKLHVDNLEVRPWGENINRPESGPARLDWKVILHPIIDKNNPPKSQEEFEKQYDNFKEQFEMVSRGMGMDEIQPVQDKKTKRAKIDYVFNNVRIRDWVNNEPELREDEMKEYFDPIYFLKNKLKDEPRHVKDLQWEPYEEEFQKIVNFAFRKTKKLNPVEHLNGYKVNKVTPQSDKWIVVMTPVVDDWFNWVKNESFQEDLEKFHQQFKDFIRMGGIDSPHEHGSFPRDIQFILSRAK